MREYRFKAYDTEWKLMSSQIDLKNGIDFFHFKEADAPHVRSLSCGTLVIMQYTGLNDKNGVEIYEGDIVNVIPKKFVTDGFIGRCEITLDGTFVFEDVKDGEMTDNWGLLSSFEVEIIGNIHENTNLLKQI